MLYNTNNQRQVNEKKQQQNNNVKKSRNVLLGLRSKTFFFELPQKISTNNNNLL